MLYIIIISHNNTAYVESILNELNSNDSEEKYRIVVKDNVNSEDLKAVCQRYNVYYLPSLNVSGFAKNNNAAVEFVLGEFDICKSDYFLFINPDAFIDKNELVKLINIINQQHPDMFTVDLYIDELKRIRDPSIRKFPSLNTFFMSYVFNKNKSIVDRDELVSGQEIEWCASSFFGMNSVMFCNIHGFDDKFFMYCEDVDICKRAQDSGMKLRYYPEITAIHSGQRNSHKIISRNFYWHLCSALRYSIIKPLARLLK